MQTVMLDSQAQQLSNLIQNCQNHLVTGVAKIDIHLPHNHSQRSRILVFDQGLLIYAGIDFPSADNLVTHMGQYLNIKNISAAIGIANRKIINTNEIKNYLDFFVNLELFSWHDVELFLHQTIIWTLEQILPYSQTATITALDQPVFSDMKDLVSFNAAQLLPTLERRQQEWLNLTPIIPSIEMVPMIKKMPEPGEATLPILAHLEQCINGKHSLIQIAHGLGQDPLMLAANYAQWVQKGWIYCTDPQEDACPLPITVSTPPKRPLILSVDDSIVVQTALKQSICDRYSLLLAKNAVEALNLLNRNPVSLVILDVTMPDIDGFELCRTIRSIGKFKEIPVIMLTAKDGMFNKLKGQMAGSTHYLTKPVSREKLLSVIDKYMAMPVII